MPHLTAFTILIEPKCRNKMLPKALRKNAKARVDTLRSTLAHRHTCSHTHTHTLSLIRRHSCALRDTLVGHVETWVLQQPGAVLPQQLNLEARCQCKQRMRSQRNSLSHSLTLSAHCADEAAEAAEAAETELKLQLKLMKLLRMREKSCWHHRLGPPIDFSGDECACNKGALHFDSCQRASDDTFGSPPPKQGLRQVNKLKCKMQKDRPSERHAFIYQMSIELISR